MNDVTFQKQEVFTPPGVTIATEEVGGVHFQIVLLRKASPLPPNSATVGDSSGSVLPANPERQGLYLKAPVENTDTIFLSIDGSDAQLDKGLSFGPGEAWSMEAHTFTADEIKGISRTAGQKLLIQEWQ